MQKELKKIDKEIEQHKWILSEQRGKDVGWREARIDWLLNHFKNYVNYHRTIEYDVDKT